jgi:hypothetical protein
MHRSKSSFDTDATLAVYNQFTGTPTAEQMQAMVQSTCPEQYAACTGDCATQLQSLLDGSLDPSSAAPGSPLGDVVACVDTGTGVDGDSGSSGGTRAATVGKGTVWQAGVDLTVHAAEGGLPPGEEPVGAREL